MKRPDQANISNLSAEVLCRPPMKGSILLAKSQNNSGCLITLSSGDLSGFARTVSYCADVSHPSQKFFASICANSRKKPVFIPVHSWLKTRISPLFSAVSVPLWLLKK